LRIGLARFGVHDRQVRQANLGAEPDIVRQVVRLITIAVIRWRIEEDHQLAKQSTGLDAGQVIRWKSWHRWTAVCLLAYIYLAVTAAVQRQQGTGSGLDAGLIPITVPELLRLLRDTVIPLPRARPSPRAALIRLATPPPTPRRPSPPTLELLC